MESKKLTRRDFLRMGALAATGVALAGCGQVTPSVVHVTGEPVVVTGEPVVVTGEPVVQTKVVEVPVTVAPKTTIQFWLPDSVRWQCLKNEMISQFNAESKIAEVEVSLLANWDQDNPARIAVIGGAGPDIFQLDIVDAREMGLGGYALPLNDMFEEQGWYELFPAWVIETVTASDGNIYCVPAEMETLVLFYNKTVFEAHGWTPPDTLDELVALCETIEAAGLIPFASKKSTWWQMSVFLNVAGVENVYKALKGELPWTDAAFEEAVSLYVDMVKKGWFMGSMEAMLAADNETYLGAFARGDAPMLISGTWFKGQEGSYFGPSTGNPNQWDWVPFPSKTGEDIYPVGFGSSYAVNPKSQKLAAVAEFLNWYNQPETQGYQFGHCITPPSPVNGITVEMMEGADPRMAAIYAAMSEAFAEGRYGYTLWTHYPADSVQWIIGDIQRVWVGDITVKEFLQGLDEIFQRELAEGKVPAVPTR